MPLICAQAKATLGVASPLSRRYRMRVPPLLALAACLCACRPTAAPPTVAFDAKAADFIDRPGTGQIKGHAFYRSGTGRVIYAAGEHVWLVPSTPYTDQRFKALYGAGKYVPLKSFPVIPDNPDYKRYTRSTKAEASGGFTFENVPPGTYYVATQVSWQPEGAFVPQGAAIYERVTLTGKETKAVEVIVSGK
jgi:hypothetical protein